MELLAEIRKAPDFGADSFATFMLHEHITVEIAKLTGMPLKKKREITWGGVVMALVLALGTGYWAFWLYENRHSAWWIAPGIVAGLMIMSAIGQLLPESVAESESARPRDESGGEG